MRFILDQREANFNGHWKDGITQPALIIECWGQGFYVGGLICMMCITVAAMKKGNPLHKLILAEQILALWHGTYCFMNFEGYSWYFSSTATLLYCSYFLHNSISWIKVRPFCVGPRPVFPKKTGARIRIIYLGTLALSAPALVFEAVNNFRYFNNINDLFVHSRPYEFLMRDPWWLFANIVLLHVLGKTYGLGIVQLIRTSPRLGILLLAIILSIGFTILDLLATIVQGKLAHESGVNPFWKLSLAFKCLTDAIILDDFATVLRDLRRQSEHRVQYHNPFAGAAKQHRGSDLEAKPILTSVQPPKLHIQHLEYPQKVQCKYTSEP